MKRGGGGSASLATKTEWLHAESVYMAGWWYYSIIHESAKASYGKKAEFLTSKRLLDVYYLDSLVIPISLCLLQTGSSPCTLALLDYHFKSTTAWGACPPLMDSSQSSKDL